MYDEGLAYRWIGKSNHDLIVLNEKFEVNPIDDAQIFYAPYQQEQEKAKGFLNFIKRQRDHIKFLLNPSSKYESFFETQYRPNKISASLENTFYFVPTLIQSQSGKYIIIGESDVIDYPGMILQKSSQNGIISKFSPYPLEEKTPNDTMAYGKIKSVTKFADYIASTKGKRNFPWRVVSVTDNPVTIPASDLISKLASPSILKGDLSWIKPGQITDEWLVNTNLFNTSSFSLDISIIDSIGFLFSSFMPLKLKSVTTIITIYTFYKMFFIYIFFIYQVSLDCSISLDSSDDITFIVIVSLIKTFSSDVSE
jgi:alpha-glucosidase